MLDLSPPKEQKKRKISQTTVEACTPIPIVGRCCPVRSVLGSTVALNDHKRSGDEHFTGTNSLEEATNDVYLLCRRGMTLKPGQLQGYNPFISGGCTYKANAGKAAILPAPPYLQQNIYFEMGAGDIYWWRWGLIVDAELSKRKIEDIKRRKQAFWQNCSVLLLAWGLVRNNNPNIKDIA